MIPRDPGSFLIAFKAGDRKMLPARNTPDI
jgi:hypothetical protein